jgi:hypothetical protein
VTAPRVSVIFDSTDRQRALNRYQRLLGTRPVAEFQIPGQELVVTAFAKFSVLSGSAEALAPVRDLRATVFVSSLKEVAKFLVETGWAREGSLGTTGSVLARDPDGNLLEFVEEPAAESRPPPSPSALRSSRVG